VARVEAVLQEVEAVEAREVLLEEALMALEAWRWSRPRGS
jgi:hypothetical protein